MLTHAAPSTVVVLLAFIMLLGVLQGTGADEGAPPPLPEGATGIAARYPGDVGIEQDPAVVLHSDFEDCRTAEDLRRTWDALVHEGNMRITEDRANVYGGRRALEITIPKQQEALAVGIDKILTEERDVLFLRFYSKLAEGFDVPRTSVHNGGSISAWYWRGESAGPGKPADGRNKFLVNFETAMGWPPGAPLPGGLAVYIYHPEQRDIYGDHFFPSGLVSPNTSLPGNFGPHFAPRPEFVPELGRWYCFEFMVKANTPGQRDGRVACWVDGKLVADFTNLRLRDVETLRIDRFGVGLYIGDNSRRENTKWYDDIVVATAYIGPRVEPQPARKESSTP